MKKRTNTAFWVEKESRWCIAVQKNGTRKRFLQQHAGPNRTTGSKRKSGRMAG